MNIGLRTTIFWNIFLLMIIAIGLISIVVFRVTQREMIKQRELAGKMVFASLEAGISGFAAGKPQQAGESATAKRVQRFFQSCIDKGLCREIVFYDRKGMPVARAGNKAGGAGVADRDVRSVLGKDEPGPLTSISDSALTVVGPLVVQGRKAGALKAVFSLHDVQLHIRKASKIIFLYILFDTVILIAFGTFLLSRYIVRPVNKVIRMTEDISEGHFDVPLYFSDRNEIGKLSSALKTMSENLKKERATIEAQLKDLEQKNLELQQAHNEIIQSEKLASVGRLAAGIAHEIGNPIGIILGYIHMLRNSSLEEKKREDYLGRMEAETERVNTTIRDLLDYAQPAAREPERIDLNELIRDAWSMVACQKDFAAITPDFHLTPDLPQIKAHAQQIRQAIVNLMLNARDAMSGGGSLTLVTGIDSDGESDTIFFTLTDTGEGMTPDIQKKIFDPFFTTKEQGKGTGLGLSNVYRITEMAGGSIDCSSVPGKGTSFTLRFPLPGQET